MFISNSYVDNVKTKDLVQLGQSVQGMNAGHVTFVTVPTGITDENGDEPPRTSDMRALFDAIINDDPLPGENDLNATTSPRDKVAEPAKAATAPDQHVGRPAPRARPGGDDRAPGRHRAGVQLDRQVGAGHQRPAAS